MTTARSLSGYKHTEEAKLKMSLNLKDKNNHPFFGKFHKKETLNLISKPGKLNPMFRKTHQSSSKKLISDKLNKHPNGIGLYDLDDNLILRYKNNIELAKYFKISKVTVGKYLNSGLVYKKIYKFKVNKV